MSDVPAISCDVCHSVVPAWRFDVPAGTLLVSFKGPHGKMVEFRSAGAGYGLCDACDKLRSHPLAARRLAGRFVDSPAIGGRVERASGLRVMEGVLGRLLGLLSNRRAYVAGAHPFDGQMRWLDPGTQNVAGQ